MPSNNRLRLDEHERRPPSGPPADQEAPQESGRCRQLRAFGTDTVQDQELVAERDYLQLERGPTPERRDEPMY
jgi:hypothetical protein